MRAASPPPSRGSALSALTRGPRSADEGFKTLQDQFCTRHCGVFENTDENKLEYTRIFESYVRMIESFVTESLSAQLPGFRMEEFLVKLAQAASRRHVEALCIIKVPFGACAHQVACLMLRSICVCAPGRQQAS